MASIQAVRSAAPALDGTSRTMLRGLFVIVAIAVTALMAALYVAELGANPDLAGDDAMMYLVD